MLTNQTTAVETFTILPVLCGGTEPEYYIVINQVGVNFFTGTLSECQNYIKKYGL